MRFLLLLITIFIFHKASAQDMRLIENTWYLHNLVIDGVDNFPPVNEEVLYVDLLIAANGLFETNVCNYATGTVDLNHSNNSFIFTDGLYITLSECNNQTNTFFEFMYFDFYLLNINDPFEYTITSQGNENLILTIVSDSGDQAIYGDQILSLEKFTAINFEIYPNPTKDVLSISSEYNSGNLEFKIFTIAGGIEAVKCTKGKKFNSLDVSSLIGGIYFLHIADEYGYTAVKKFVKN